MTDDPSQQSRWGGVDTNGYEVTAANLLAYRDANNLTSAQALANSHGCTTADWNAAVASIKAYHDAGGITVWANSNYGQNDTNNGYAGLDDADLALRLEALASVDTKLKQTFDPILDEALPSAVLDMLSENSADDSASNVVQFEPRKTSRNVWQLPSAIAASLVGGFFISQGISGGAGNDTGLGVGPVPASAELHAVLSTQPSGQAVGGITPILSFQTQDGDVCREFTAANSRGLACNAGDGWSIVTQIYISNQNTGAIYGVANAGSSDGFDAVIDSRMDGDILSPLQEEQLIKTEWKFAE